MSLNVKLIRESFGAIRPHVDEVLEKFYSTLFKKYPQAAPLFDKVDMEQQRKALAGSLAKVIDNLEDPSFISPLLQKLGARHVAYGTQPEHFAWVGEALLSTLAYYFEAQWTEEMKEEWTKLYTIAAEQMQMGMKDTSLVQENRPQPTLPELALSYARTILEKAVSEEVNDQFMTTARSRAQETLKKALQHEADHLMEAVSKKAG